ncbi:MAG TPA: APC family permease [Clostridia bacterium]|nr:APC family permease [Clostridia bacterium]
MKETSVFLRKASGLVRAWSVFDAFIYAFFSINLITLGLYIFSFAPFLPEAHLVPAIVVSGIFIMFEIVVYAMLISAMPRAGGDYVWQSRLLGGAWGFVLSMTGWVFILWHWVPLYGTMMVYEVFTPLLTILGGALKSQALLGASIWFSGQHGLFLGSIIVIGWVSFVITMGMKWYARIQKFCFYLGIVGLATVFVVLLTTSKETFVSALNGFAQSVFGVAGNAYEETLKAASNDGYTPVAWSNMAVLPSLSLIPMVVFFNLWPNWGATLYGEVRGAGDFKRNFWGMALALIVTTILAVIFLGLIARTMGWDFYLAANHAWYAGTATLPLWPYPGFLAAVISRSLPLQIFILISLGAWFFGWAGTVFLSSTRVVFAAAFDRALPDWIANVSKRRASPVNALLAMAIPSTIVAIMYSYVPGFMTFTLDTTVVIAITYFGTTIAAIIMPYRDPELYRSSPIGKYQVGGIPLITLSGVIFAAFLVFNLYKWIVDPVYGVNNPLSALYMGSLYVLAVALYYGFRSYRKRQGIDLDMVYKEIPVE